MFGEYAIHRSLKKYTFFIQIIKPNLIFGIYGLSLVLTLIENDI